MAFQAKRSIAKLRSPASRTPLPAIVRVEMIKGIGITGRAGQKPPRFKGDQQGYQRKAYRTCPFKGAIHRVASREDHQPDR